MSNGASGAEARTRTTAVTLTDVDITFRLADGRSEEHTSELQSR